MAAAVAARFRPCPFRRPSVAAGRPPRARTLRPAEARDLQPERLAKEPRPSLAQHPPAEAERGVRLKGLASTHTTANVTTENAFLPLAPLAAHSFTLRVRPLHRLQRIRGSQRTTA